MTGFSRPEKTASSIAADTPALIRTVKAVGPAGAGSEGAARAWRELARLPARDDLSRRLRRGDDLPAADSVDGAPR